MKPSLKSFTYALVDFAIEHGTKAVDRPEALTIRWLEADDHWKQVLLESFWRASFAEPEPPLVILYAFKSAHLTVCSPYNPKVVTQAHTILDQTQQLIEFLVEAGSAAEL